MISGERRTALQAAQEWVNAALLQPSPRLMWEGMDGELQAVLLGQWSAQEGQPVTRDDVALDVWSARPWAGRFWTWLGQSIRHQLRDVDLLQCGWATRPRPTSPDHELVLLVLNRDEVLQTGRTGACHVRAIHIVMRLDLRRGWLISSIEAGD